MIICIVIFILFIIILYIIYLNNVNVSTILYESYINKDKYTAIIIEPRKHKALEYVLDNFLTNLDDQWNFIIFHGNLNSEYVYDIINNKLSEHKNRIKLINLNIDNLTLHDYNKLLVSKDLYNYIPTEVFLIFQTDSIICNIYKDLIYNYIKYDYVGAPWKNKNIGNGGLSLRRKSKMIEIIDNCKYDNKPEDVYFSLSCPNIYRNIPSFEDAQKFSVETVYNDISFGVHKPWLHLKKEYILKKNNFCEGLNTLTKLNK